MAEYQFTLVLSGDVDNDATLDALFERGCDDATFGTIDGVGYGDFARQAASFGEALRTAIAAVESVDGVLVTRVEPDDLVTMAEIAERTGRSRESVRLLIRGQRGSGGFPPPASHLRARSRLWRWSEVAAWFEETSPQVDRGQATLIAAINALLSWRANSSALTPSERDLVSALI